MKNTHHFPMRADDIEVFSEIILEKYGSVADMQALKIANGFLMTGDRRNGDVWLLITDKVRELQNVRNILRNG